MMPSPERFSRVIAWATEASKAFNAAEDDKARLKLTIATWEEAISYFASSPEARAAGLIRLLGFSEKALFNASRGAKPPELNHPPETSRPTGTTREFVQIEFAWALELLVRSGWGTERAARFVAEEARKARVTDPNGLAIPWKNIDQWRKDLRRNRGSAEMLRGWKDLLENPAVPYAWLLRGPRSDPKRSSAEQAVRVILRSLADTDPRGAPTIHRRQQS